MRISAILRMSAHVCTAMRTGVRISRIRRIGAGLHKQAQHKILRLSEIDEKNRFHKIRLGLMTIVAILFKSSAKVQNICELSK